MTTVIAIIVVMIMIKMTILTRMITTILTS